MEDSRTITIPNWCKIGKIVKVRYAPSITGSLDFYRERIIGYSDTGFFTQDDNCPVYHHTFDEYGKSVIELDY